MGELLNPGDHVDVSGDQPLVLRFGSRPLLSGNVGLQPACFGVNSEGLAFYRAPIGPLLIESSDLAIEHTGYEPNTNYLQGFTLRLNKAQAGVAAFYFTVTLNPLIRFEHMSEVYCSFFANDATEGKRGASLGNFVMHARGPHSALLMLRVVRRPKGIWCIQPIGEYAMVRTASQLPAIIQQYTAVIPL